MAEVSKPDAGIGNPLADIGKILAAIGICFADTLKSDVEIGKKFAVIDILLLQIFIFNSWIYR